MEMDDMMQEKKNNVLLILLRAISTPVELQSNELRRKNTNSSPHTVDRLALCHSSAGPYQNQHKKPIAVASH